MEFSDDMHTAWTSSTSMAFWRWLVTQRPAPPHVEILGYTISDDAGGLADARIIDPDGQVCTRASGVFQPNRRVIPRDLWERAGL